MNPRIQELVEEARTHWAENNQTDKNRQEPGLYYHVDVLEKFAELLIRECADLVMNDENAFELLEHFGIQP